MNTKHKQSASIDTHLDFTRFDKKQATKKQIAFIDKNFDTNKTEVSYQNLDQLAGELYKAFGTKSNPAVFYEQTGNKIRLFFRYYPLFFNSFLKNFPRGHYRYDAKTYSWTLTLTPESKEALASQMKFYFNMICDIKSGVVFRNKERAELSKAFNEHAVPLPVPVIVESWPLVDFLMVEYNIAEINPQDVEVYDGEQFVSICPYEDQLETRFFAQFKCLMLKIETGKQEESLFIFETLSQSVTLLNKKRSQKFQQQYSSACASLDLMPIMFICE